MRESMTASPTAPRPDDLYKPRYTEDAEGYLYDCGFREMISNRGIDRDQMDSAEALRAVVMAGKVVTQSFEENLHAQGLSHPQFRALMALRHGPREGLHMHRIAMWLGVTPRNVTAIVDFLEGQGLVRRVPDPADRRAFKVGLTPAGEERSVAALKVNKQDQKEVLGALTVEERKQLRHLCVKLVRAVKEPAAAKEVR